jgi:uncharacterized protein
MEEDAFALVELTVASFEWDPRKGISNFGKHDVDFRDAAKLLLEPHIARRSDRGGEARYLAVVADGEIAVVYTFRGETCRMISARPARPDEQRQYREILGRGAAEAAAGED